MLRSTSFAPGAGTLGFEGRLGLGLGLKLWLRVPTLNSSGGKQETKRLQCRLNTLRIRIAVDWAWFIGVQIGHLKKLKGRALVRGWN